MADRIGLRLTPESENRIAKLIKLDKLDLRPSLEVIGIGYRKEVDLIFKKKQPRREGRRWGPLSDAYGTWKAKHFPGKPLLVRTGALKRSMTEKGAKGNINAISAKKAVFGSSIFYGIYHDSDEPRTSNLPQRNFSEPSDRRAQIWKGQIEKDIKRQFKEAGIEVEGDIFVSD